MAWATIADVLSITTKTVTQESIDASQFLVEIFSDVTEESTDSGVVSSTNLRLLKGAVAYQAAWMTAHPDQFTTTDFESFQQDGLSVDNRHANAMILAPMAKRCIDRLSWKRNRSIYVRPMGGPRSYDSRNVDQNNAVLDDYDTNWRPLDI
ncbi:hypothetical protein ACPYPG_08240 [Streptomyces sp. FR-108]|uniref:hypothetical protein n=1 Tax=Streptomyces sp. FR-108 TaxID=3416665 RepID=UPI003CF76FE2